MRRSAWWALVPTLALASGCSPTVGTACNEELARTIVYDQGGSPAYEGQAMLITSCAGGGGWCHASTARQRYGAPFGMNFDPTLADTTLDVAGGAQHLYAAQLLSHHLRDDVFAQVSSGQMPPRGIGDSVAGMGYRRYSGATDTTGTPIADLRSADGRELLRNWLACGSPVVEGTTFPIAIPCTSDADCQLTHRCDVSQGECFDVGAIVDARMSSTMPNFTSIYQTVLMPTCATPACHGSAGAPFSGNLDMSTPAMAYAALVGTPGSLPGCGTRVVAGDPTMSLLIAKLDGTQNPGLCGAQMPIGLPLPAAQIDAIRQWVMDGALMN